MKTLVFTRKGVFSSVAVLTVGLVGLSQISSQAASAYYDISNASGLTPGAATWDAGTTPAWATSATPGTAAPGVWTNGDDAFFQTTGTNTVTISGTVIANSLTQTLGGTTTTISSGTLQLGLGGLANTGGNALTINSDISLSGSQTWNANNNTTTVGGIIGDGGSGYFLRKTGGSTLVLTGANTYSGPTFITAGTLQIGTATTGSVTGDYYMNGGNLSFARTDSYTVGNAVRGGNGTLTKSGAGTLTLTSANTYQSATTISAGALQLNNAKAAQNSVVTISATNGLAFGTGIGSFTLQGLSGASNEALVDSGANAVTLTVGSWRNTGSNTYSGILSGAGGITKIGKDTQALSGANTLTGSILVQGGTLTGTTPTGTTPVGTGAITLRGGTLGLAPTGTGSAVAYTGASVATGTKLTYGGNSTLSLNRGTQTSLTFTAGNVGETGSVLAREGNGTLMIRSTGSEITGSLGTAEKFLVTGTAPAIANGMVTPSIVLISSPTGTLSNLNSSTVSATVTSTAATLPSGLVPGSFQGSSLLGQRVTAITGSSGNWTITLAGNANANLTNGSSVFTSLGTYGNFVTYDNTNGFTAATAAYTSRSGSIGAGVTSATEITNLTAATTFTGNNSTYALVAQPQTTSITINSGITLSVGDNTAGHQAGVIVNATGQNPTFLSGGTIAFGASEGVVSVFGNTGGIGGISTSFTGTGGVTFSGAGPSVGLTGTNTFSGGLTVNNGFKLAASGTASAYGDVSNIVTLNGGGFFTVSGTNMGTSRSVVLTSAGGTIDGGNQSLALGGNISGVGPLIINGGSSIQRFTGNNTYTGATILTAGEMVISTNANIGGASSEIVFAGTTSNNGGSLGISGTQITSFGSHTVSFINGVNLDIMNSANVFTLDRVMDQAASGSYAAFAKNGAGTVVLTAANAYTNSGANIATAMNGGLLRIDAQQGGSLAPGGHISFSGGDLELLGKTAGTTSQVLGNVTVNARGGTVTANGSTGSGTTLMLGTLAPTAAGATLDVRTIGTASVTTGTSAAGGILGNNRVTFNGADWATNGAVDSAISAYAGYSAMATTGTNVVNSIQSDGATLTGALTTNSLKITTTVASQSLAQGGNLLTLTSGGLLFTGANDYTISGGNLASGTATNSDLIVHQGGSGVLTIGSTIANGIGTSTLTKAGSGKLVLTQANTYTGATYINDGVLSISNDNQLGATAGATLFLNGTLQTTASVTTARVISLGTNGGTFDLINGSTLTVSGAVKGQTSGNNADSGGLTLTSTSDGILVFSNNNGFYGDVDIKGGTLRFGSAAALSTGGANSLNLSGTGKAQVNGFDVTVADITGTSSTVIENSSSTATAKTFGTYAGSNTTFAGTIRDNDGSRLGTLSFLKGGGGTLILSGGNTYSGTTTIQNGTLLISGTHTGAGAYTVQGPSGDTRGILGGTGTITTAGNAGISLLAGGRLSPGSSAGTLTANLGTGSLNLSAGVAATGTQALIFELGATSDQFALSSGGLNIGSGVLEFDDFSFTSLSGFGEGTYVLFNLQGSGGADIITGSLGANVTGTIGGFSSTLAISGNDLVLNVVPEPSTWALLAAGLTVVVTLRRRRS